MHRSALLAAVVLAGASLRAVPHLAHSQTATGEESLEEARRLGQEVLRLYSLFIACAA